MSRAMTTTESTSPGPADGSGAMFDRIARRYDRLNRLMSFGMDRGWRRKLVRALGPVGAGDEVLDLATGTADVALAVAGACPGVRVTGLDPSGGMLEVGRDKVARAGFEERVELVEGDAQALELQDDRFAATCIAFGIRNVPDRCAALREMARVVRPGGRIAILELTQPRGRWTSPFARFHMRHVVPRLGSWLSQAHEYDYLQRSIQAFPPPDAFVAEMAAAGIADPRARRLTMGTVHLFVGEAR